MKVALLAPSPVPFMVGGAEAAWSGLYRELSGRSGIEAELLKLPSPERSLPEVMASYEQWYRLPVDQFDRVVAGKYPAWMVRHPDKVIYLLHPLRGLYDTYPAHLPRDPGRRAPGPVRRLVRLAQSLGKGAEPAEVFAAWDDTRSLLGEEHPAYAFPGPLARVLVHALDTWAMGPPRARRWLAISDTVRRRPGYLPTGVPTAVAVPPPDLAGLHRSADQAFFFTASRLDPPKRIDLIIDAYRRTTTTLPLVIAGVGPDESRLKQAAAGDPRIQWVGRLSAEDLADHYARALAVVFTPQDEDLGLITLEAFASATPVVTVSDSGGPTEFVVDGETGRVTAPDPAVLAQALDDLAADPALAARLGAAAAERVSAITWSAAADAVLGPPPLPRRVAAPPPRAGARPLAVVVAPFSFAHPLNGGQLRARHLTRALTATFDVEALCLVPAEQRSKATSEGPHLTHRAIARSAEHERRLADLASTARTPVDDILCGGLAPLTPAYGAELAAALSRASVVVMEHPYPLDAVAAAGGSWLPLVHDAQNVEAELKADTLPESSLRSPLLALVRALEAEATRSCDVTTCVSDDERLHLNAVYGGSLDRLVTIPNGVDLAQTPFSTGSARTAARAELLARLALGRPAFTRVRRLVLFVGSWHGPNIVAARDLLRWARGLDDLGVVIAGSVCDAVRAEAVPGNVALLRHVSDQALAALLSGVDAAVNPVDTGAGSNLKLVQYLASGAAVLTTPFGARGFDLPPGLVTEAELDDFPAALLDPDLYVRPPEVAHQARDLAEQYDWAVIGRRHLAAVAAAAGVAAP